MSEDHLKGAAAPPALDDSLYNLNEEQLEFLKKSTGIEDSDELKKHILDIQAQAYNHLFIDVIDFLVFPYPCIRYFTFAKLGISRLPNYERILKLPQSRPGAIFLDIGCCFGSDLRKVVYDGWPVEDTIGSDIFQGLWALGHKLYRTTPDDFPAGFVAGDAFDENILSSQEPPHLSPRTSPRPLTSLSSLNPLRGQVDAVHASLFFHLFDEEKQLQLARRLASLLNSKPDSVIFGGHYVRPEKGLKKEVLGNGREHIQFWHSPESWAELWSGNIFREGTVKVDVEWVEDETHFTELQRNGKIYYVKWCVTRLEG